MTEFFKQLVGLAGYGLVGIAIVMVIVLAYVVIKRPNNKFAILILTGFCMFIMALFTFAGVGVVKENKEIRSQNEVLKDSSQVLSENNSELNDSIKITNAKLNIASLQYTTLIKPELSKDSLSEIVNSIARSLDTLSANDISAKRNEWTNLSNDYKSISAKLSSNEYNTQRAKQKIFQNNEKIPVSEKARVVGKINE